LRIELGEVGERVTEEIHGGVPMMVVGHRAAEWRKETFIAPNIMHVFSIISHNCCSDDWRRGFG
jgi:hypothetical protein